MGLLLRRPAVVLAAVLLPSIPEVVGLASPVVLGRESMVPLALLAPTAIAWLYLQLGANRALLYAIRGHDVGARTFLVGPAALASGLATWVAMRVAQYGGLILLVVPGVVLQVGLELALLAVADGERAWPALRASWRLSRGVKMAMWVNTLAYGLVHLALILATRGLWWACITPAYAVIQALMYEALRARHADGAP